MVAGVGAMALTPRRHEQTIGRARIADIMPNHVGVWSTAPSSNMVLPDAAQPSSFYDQVFTRTYQAAKAPTVMLLIAYGAAQSGMMKVHRPEVCYGSAGFTIRDLRPVALPLGLARPVEATAFMGVREDRREAVLYWTRISNAFPKDLLQQRLVMLQRGLAGVIPDGVLVRCSIMDPTPEGFAALSTFARALVADASSQGRKLLIGAAPVASSASQRI